MSCKQKPTLRHIVFCLAVFCVAGFCAAFAEGQEIKNPAPTRAAMSQAHESAADDNAIFALLLLQNRGTKMKPLVVVKNTIVWKELSWQFKPSLRWYSHEYRVTESLLAAIKTRNQKSQSISASVVPPPLILTSQTRVDQIFKQGWWQRFYKTFPNTAGYVNFSMPGYSADGQTALVYYHWGAGGQAGEGTVYLLTKQTGMWKIKRALSGFRA